mgnify:CR=1 FL=1
MATSSFNKDFILDTKKAVVSFEKIISTPKKNLVVDKNILTGEKERKGEERLKQILSL